MTVSGSPNTRYYVYVTLSTLYMSTTPPNQVYTKLEVYGNTSLQVGDICMTSNNTLSGSWNVCSSFNEPSRSWTTAINSSSVTLSLPGLIQSKRISGVVSRSGSTTFNWSCGTTDLPVWVTRSVTPGLGTTDTPFTERASYSQISAILRTVISLGGFNNIEGINSNPTYSDSYSTWVTASNVYFLNPSVWASVASRSGSLILTRSSS